MTPARYDAFDLLATLVALATPDGTLLFVNTGFEAVVGQSRRSLVRTSLFDRFADPAPLRETLYAVAHNEIATGRLQARLRRAGSGDELPVQVIVTQVDSGAERGRGGAATEQVLVEMIEVEQQTRQDREERALDQIEANKELIRNLAHEIKNPLGGIRGAAQLLAMELGQPPDRSRDERPQRGANAASGAQAAAALAEYTDVIVHEADRLQALVDRLLAPHRRPHVVGDVNIHEVCERVRSLVLVEHPRGLEIVRDYDVSLPEFRGDREQLIQALLNVVQNAAHALAGRIAAGDAKIALRTRVARQVTLGKQRCRLALELHVEDNGPGVADSVRDRIFFPLVSGREGGSGLGLTLAQMFVQQHHGSIDFDSVPGRTVFSIMIPLP